ncbi:MAG: hypothetical protein QOE36_2732, partial [Gaiellaceae bacterium]|nr:hypothetical protein [Gaiellaceae bacterium]
MERWTRWVLRHRYPVLAVWLAVLVLGTAAFLRLPALLANDFVVPGTDSERARTIQQEHFGQRSDGNFQVVFRVRDSRDASVRRRANAALVRAARAVPTARAEAVLPAGRTVLFGTIGSRLKLSRAKGYTDDLRAALGQPAGTRAYVTGAAAISRDLDPVFSADLAKGEGIALPIALAVLLAVFGLSVAVTLPFLFAGCTIMGTLGIVW